MTWQDEVRAMLAPYTSIHCRQARILAAFAAESPYNQERLNWLVAEAKRQGFNLKFTVESDGIRYDWKQRRIRFTYVEE